MRGEASTNHSASVALLSLLSSLLLKAFSLFTEVNYFLIETKRLHYDVISTTCCSLGESLSPWKRNFDILPAQPRNSKEVRDGLKINTAKPTYRFVEK